MRRFILCVAGLAVGLASAATHETDATRADALTRAAAEAAVQQVFRELVEAQRSAREQELEDRAVNVDGKTLRWLERTFGDRPEDGRSLWISLHGGGNAATAVNDQQWRNQAQLYQPDEGIYVAPRAPTDTWNLWHQSHIDPLFSRLIENMVALRGVNPDKVYLLGYSAGGDGVWQLAPRMADRFAAAAMMAGHPNEARVDGLRNLPFAIFVGAGDGGYNRNSVAAERADRLARLASTDPDGYTHLFRSYEGLGHWMNGRDAEALPWMAQHSRRTWPRRVVWLQDDVIHDRFYWLQLPEDAEKEAGQRIVAAVDGQHITLEGDVPVGTRLLLSDALLDLDQPVTVRVNDGPASEFRPVRETGVIRRALQQRLDPKAVPTATITVGRSPDSRAD